jgi:hypothetical protein
MVSASTAGQYLQNIPRTAGPQPASGEHVRGDPCRFDGLCGREDPAWSGGRSPIPGDGWRSNAGTNGEWQASGCRPAGGDAMEGGVEAGMVSQDLREAPWDPEKMRKGFSGKHTKPPTPLGSGELSLANPMEPPPSVVPGRGNGPESTPDRLGLSSATVLWRALDGGHWRAARLSPSTRSGP